MTTAEDDVLVPVAGIVDVADRHGFVRTSGYLPGPDDVYVSAGQLKRYGLRRGDLVVGTARFTVGSAVHDAPPGTLVMVPPGVPHSFANPGDEPVVMLNTFTPDLYVQYFRDLRDATADGQRTTAQAAAEVMGRYSTTVTTDYA